VVLLDAALASGTVDILLNVQDPSSIRHLLPKLDELERADFEAILTRHATGIEALLLHDLGLDGVRPEEMRKILLSLRRVRDFVVVDTWPILDENMVAILDVADRVLLILTPEITALRGARRFLEQSRQLGLSRERIVPVLNRSPLKGGLQRRDIENTLGVSMQATIPDDIKLVTYGINRGIPVVESHHRSGVARHIAGLAKAMVQVAHQR
jgi:pilus assembly protein CpaE